MCGEFVEVGCAVRGWLATYSCESRYWSYAMFVVSLNSIAIPRVPEQVFIAREAR